MLVVNNNIKKYFEDNNNIKALEAIELLQKEIAKAENEIRLKKL